MPEPSLKIEKARFVVTVDADRRIIEDGAVLIEGGVIVATGKTVDLADRRAERTIDATEMVVTPGFLNGHMHISYAHAVRGIFPDDVPNRLALVFEMQAAMTEEEEYLTTLLGLVELLRTGTTTIVDPGTTKFPAACMAAYEAAGCRVAIGEQAIDLPNGLNLPVLSTADSIDRMEASVAELHGRLDGRMRAWTMPFSLQVCSPELIAAAKRIADDHDTMMTIHHSGAGEADATPTGELAEIGGLGSNVVISHGMNLTDSDVRLLAESGTSVAICPSTVMKNGAGTAAGGRLPEFLDAGVAVALATDSANSSNFLDMVRCMSVVATVYKDARGDTGLIPPETALELATRTGARALGYGEELGAVEVGRRADLVLFDTRCAQWRSLIEPVRNLVYSASGDSVDTVVVDGRIVVEGGRPVFIDDEWALIERVEGVGRRVRAATGLEFPSAWPVV